MRMQELQDTLRKTPFEPFRIRLSDGQSLHVRHPEFAGLTRHSVFVGVPSGKDAVPDRMIQCDLVHVVTIEPIDGARPRRKDKGEPK
ncbi:MAG: hypothetical protein O7B26_09540 [Planctomycetota bacterium]|nr:hypothetical protein [Planctomycetota bacterium]